MADRVRAPIDVSTCLSIDVRFVQFAGDRYGERRNRRSGVNLVRPLENRRKTKNDKAKGDGKPGACAHDIC